jgi:hypothetical protein
MDIADWKGDAFRRRLASAERLSDAAMRLGLLDVKMLDSRSSALLVCITRCEPTVSGHLCYEVCEQLNDQEASASPGNGDQQRKGEG